MLDEQALSESTGGCGLPLVQERGLMDTEHCVRVSSYYARVFSYYAKVSAHFCLSCDL